jgi:hypothetical protein
MTPARYAVSVDNNQMLKQYEGAAIRLGNLTASSDYSANCRLMGPIKAADGMSIPDFIQKAFNDEFKFANVYSDSGINLSGTVTKVEFSSTSGLTDGWWDLGIKLTSSNGASMEAENRHSFKSGFDAITACNQTAQALGSAVQDLIKKVISDPQFSQLIR